MRIKPSGWRAKSKEESYQRIRIRNSWFFMVERCTNPKAIGYERYGGRGILVCREWDESFEAFYQWSISAGHVPGLQLDRIDNNGNYCPENCRWVTRKQNARNRRDTVLLSAFGETKCLKDWSIDERCKLSETGLLRRLARRPDFTIEQALTLPNQRSVCMKRNRRVS